MNESQTFLVQLSWNSTADSDGALVLEGVCYILTYVPVCID